MRIRSTRNSYWACDGICCDKIIPDGDKEVTIWSGYRNLTVNKFFVYCSEECKLEHAEQINIDATKAGSRS